MGVGILSAPFSRAAVAQALGEFASRAGEIGVVDPSFPRGDVRRYGAVHSPTATDDATGDVNRLAFARAFAASRTVIFGPGESYWFGTFTNAKPIGVLVSGVDDIHLVTNGANVRGLDAHTDGNPCSFFRFIDCERIRTIGVLHAIGSQVSHQQGPCVIQVVCDAKDISGFSLDVCGEKVRCPVEFMSSAANALAGNVKRARHIRVFSDAKDSMYGYLGTEQGDSLEYHVRTKNVVRSFYVAGINGYRGVVESFDHQASSGDILMVTYQNDLCNGYVRYIPHGNVSPDFLVRISHYKTVAPNNVVGPSAGKRIENIHVEIDDTYAVGGNWCVTLREEDVNDAAQANSPHIMDNIRVTGKFTRYNQPDTIVQCATNFAVAGRLYIDPSFTSLHGLLMSQSFANFMLHMGGRKWARSIIGDLDNLSLDFDLRRIVTPSSGGMPCVFKTQLQLIQDVTGSVGGGGMATAYREHVHHVFLNGAGTAADLARSAALLSDGYGGYNPTVSFAQVTPGVLSATFAGASGGTPANGRCVGTVEIV